jgi:hypothetical protein
MWTTLALATALSLAPQQAGPITLTNVRATYGAPGLPRTDNKALPGDLLTLVFDIEGVAIDPAGKVTYSTALELADAKGKVVFKQDPRDHEIIAGLGGSSVPGLVTLEIGLDQPPGEYSARITVTDRGSKKSATLTRNFTVLPAGFGIVRLNTTADPEGLAPVSVFQTGGSLFINTGVVGFLRDKVKGQPDVAVELRVLDENGKPTLKEPFQGVINDKVPSNARFVPVQFLVPLNRSGKFTVELKATCRLARATSTIALPIVVVASK